jgi:PKD repeat protein
VAVALTYRTALVGAFGNQSLSGAAYLYESPDTDGDGLPDDWEINGITVDSNGVISVGNTGNGVFINLPAMGADPKHKDIFVHLDWMQDSPDGVSFKPNPRAIKMVIDSFAIAPVDNPDSKPGINLHVDFGATSIMNPVTGETWGTKSAAGDVPYQAVLEGTPGSAADWPIALDSIKTDRFNPNGRNAVFHYALYCQRYGDSGNKVGGGISRGIDGSDFLLGVGSIGFNPIQEASFFMHELGHNLGLHHGGGEDIQFKPNYISIMNYRFDYIGTLKGSGGRAIDYSRRALDTLNETNLDETVGINDPDGHLTTWNFWSHVDGGPHNPCIDNPDEFNRLFYPAKALDWNCNGVADTAPVSVDINSDAKCVRSSRADGLLYATPAGDDVVIGPYIMSGPNRVCETAPACGFDANGRQQCDIRDDNQNGLPAGYVEPTLLTGFNDWPNLRFDGGEKIGSSTATTAQRNQGTAAADTIVPPHELSTEEIAAEIPAPLIAEMGLAPLDVVTVSKQASGGSLVATFDGSGSIAVTGTIVKWTWDFGDGTTGTGANVTHTYNTSGDYFASLTVTDSNGHITLVPLLQRITVAGVPTPTPTPSPSPSASPTPAQGRYSFTRVVDNTQVFNGRQFDFRGTPPQINDGRTLAFSSQVDDVNHNLVDLGYFRITPGGTPTTIASLTTGISSLSQFGGFPFINAAGLVSVTGATVSNESDRGIYVGSGGPLTKIASNAADQPFLDFNNSDTWINTSGTVAFRADLRAGGAGIFTGKGGAVTTIADSSRFSYLGDPVMTDAGAVVFWGRTNAGTEGIFANPGGVISAIADTSGEFSSFGLLPTINASGSVAFQAYRDDNSNGIFLAQNGVVTTIADSNGAFGNFYPGASINNNGTVVFEGFLKTGNAGIFTGPDPVVNKVIAVGDSLFGGTVTNVAFFRGLNNNNDIAFTYTLDTKVNGILVEGVAIASPRTVLANISTRMLVQTGDNALIGGFIVTGTQPKKLIVRGIGPSLPVNGKLADPTLELRDSTGALVEANDNWGDAANRQEIIDSKIPPNNAAESAILRSVLPGAYTAILRGANNTTGVGVVEVYDLDLTVDSKLANISTRGLVQTGDNVMIGGFIVAGSAPQNVIVRAIGPSLSIPGKLEDPTLELRDQNGGLIDSNDNWIDSPNKQAIIDSTVPPTNNLESAIVATLPSSGAQYTGIVRGVNNTTGIAVVEVYALP